MSQLARLILTLTAVLVAAASTALAATPAQQPFAPSSPWNGPAPAGLGFSNLPCDVSLHDPSARRGSTPGNTRSPSTRRATATRR